MAKRRKDTPNQAIELKRIRQKSKAAAPQQTKETETLTEQRKLMYSSSSDNKSYTSNNKKKLKFSPTVKIMNIASDSPGTPPFEIVSSSNPDDFMNDNESQPK